MTSKKDCGIFDLLKGTHKVFHVVTDKKTAFGGCDPLAVFVYSELVVIAQSGVEFTLLSILVTVARPPDS